MSSISKFRKQFIASKKRVEIFKYWNTYQIGDLHLYAHPELKVNFLRNHQFEIALLGDAFDYKNAQFLNDDILGDVKDEIKKGISVFEAFNKYAGVYAVFFLDKLNGKLITFNDASAQREIYYLNKPGQELALGSQTKLINHFFPSEMDDSAEAVEFYSSKQFSKRKAYVGNLTEYKHIKHLKPNHYLDLIKREPVRFFPIEALEKGDFNEVAEKAAKRIRGYLEAAANRYRLLVPVSAGWDSRVILAATKHITDKCHYYVWMSKPLLEKHPDIRIPQKMMADFRLKFEIVNKDIKIDQSLINIVEESITFPNDEFIKYVLGYWAKFENHISIIGNVSEIARMEWSYLTGINELKIAQLQQYSSLQYALNYYKKWIAKNKQYFAGHQYYIVDMLYWEENCGNGLARSNTESKMGIEYFLPFNSRELLVLLLSVDKKYREKQNAKLYSKIIDILWQECAFYPINPGFKKKIISMMQRLRVYSFYRNVLLNLQASKMRIKMIRKKLLSNKK
ncbi:MAG: hypothetical protein OXH57_06065 [Ekhidna sp.]|nr:hypothetical protein [Ekhidna sp.]